jgi:hypothetical protein
MKVTVTAEPYAGSFVNDLMIPCEPDLRPGKVWKHFYLTRLVIS